MGMCMMHYHCVKTQLLTPPVCVKTSLDIAPPLRVMVTNIQQDATNSCVWQRRKLMNAIARTVVPHSAVTDTLTPEFDVACWFATCDSITGMCDALPVDGGSSGHTVALLQKQLDSLKCPHFQTFSGLDLSRRHIAIQLHITDGGSDQILAKKHLALQASPFMNFWYVPCYCLYHKYSLG